MQLRNPLTVAQGDLKYLSYLQDVACLSGDVVGNTVCVRGDRVNGKWRVETADPRDVNKMPALGILISKSTPTVGVMRLFGPCESFTGMTPGKSYFVNGSSIALTMPDPLPGGYAIVQRMGLAVASDRLWLPGDLTMYKKIT